jgi:ATP-binding cassette subfamily F protein uup
VLDEPTNDLDLETLELLEAELVEWPGTLLLVTHDRAFLDNVVTSTLVCEGDGRVEDYAGGYEDWLRQRPEPRVPSSEPRAPSLEPRVLSSEPRVPSPESRAVSPESKKLSYKEQRELEGLPGRIESLEAEQRALNAKIADPAFYSEAGDTIRAAVSRLEALEAELSEVYARWDALDSRG